MAPWRTDAPEVAAVELSGVPPEQSRAGLQVDDVAPSSTPSSPTGN